MFKVKCSKRRRLIKVLGLGAIVGLIVLSMETRVLSSPSLTALEDMFIKVAEESGRSVVSITAVQTGTVRHIDPFEHFLGRISLSISFPGAPPASGRLPGPGRELTDVRLWAPGLSLIKPDTS